MKSTNYLESNIKIKLYQHKRDKKNVKENAISHDH